MRALAAFGSAFVFLSLLSSTASAETRTVGAGKQHATLAEAIDLVNPGDVVEVFDDQAFASDGLEPKRSGQPNAKITLRGMKNAQGKRPKLSGGAGKYGFTIFFQANHYIFENFEVTGGEQACIAQKANDLTIRDSVIHDCPRHGILGFDEANGSLTLEYTEVYKCGLEKSGEALKHPVYVSSDPVPGRGFPGSVFRMHHCWVHDARDGNNVKSRAERNEIRYNWIEGAGYYELELIGPDLTEKDAAREDSEVVGNVFFKTNNKSDVVRIGGDGTGETNGRYRFLNNTFILSSTTQGLLRGNDGIESLEFSNNVAYRLAGVGINSVFRSGEARWKQGKPLISGASNWFPEGSGDVPKELTGTILGKDPGFISTNPLDLRPKNGSALIDKGTDNSPPAPNAAFPNPLAAPESFPLQRALPAVGSIPKRERTGAPDIGAYELNADAPPGAPGSETNQPPPGSSGGDGTEDADGGQRQKRDVNICGCRFVAPNDDRLPPAFALALAALTFVRRRRR